MGRLTELVERYTDIWNHNDLAGFRTMVLDGCIRHDPGGNVAIPIADNEARFAGVHQELAGLRITNQWLWEHGDDVITVCFSIRHDTGAVAGIEVFRFADDRIVEVWNAPAGAGPWVPSAS